MSKKILIAKVISAFGIKGEVKMVIYSDNHLNIEKYSLFNAKGEAIKVKISNKNKTVIGTSSGDPIVIAKIDGVNDRNASELLRNSEIFVERKDLAPTKKNEFYYSDLVDLDVIDVNSKKVGKVINVLDYGAGGIIEIKFLDNQIENFPFKNEIFPEVDLEKNFIRIEEIEIVNAKKD
jgi:16S rRNA processing protein RimM